jgi:NAD(P)-dependent dehydrogenase (short-subunit alcohol dehydrogenase family)
MKLKDRVAIVTGGSSGIGRGICLEFAREGARVVVSDLREAPKKGRYHEQDTTTPTTEELAKIGGRSHFVQTDMADEGAVRNLVDEAVSTFGSLDIIVNNAGIHIPGGAQDISIAQWDQVVGTNLRAVFVATKLAIPHLKRSKFGRIIQIASVHAYGGGAGPAYAPAKAGVVNMVRDTAMEVGEFGITVNAICPGYIETSLQDYLTQEMIDAVAEKTALPRFGKPRDVGRAAVFLASDDAEWVTGASLLVDGGLITGT